jgi:transcriptional regulator with XRE-family HTH domain
MGDLSLPSVDWFDAETTTFGDRVTGAREAAGMGQAELAKRLGVKVKTVRGWENDQNEPRANKLGMLAGVLGVSMMWLLSGQGDGLDSPEETAPVDEDLEQLLLDIRQMRQEQTLLAERMGRLEKRLRVALAGA